MDYVKVSLKIFQGLIIFYKQVRDQACPEF